jgi:streptogramin lyase
VRHARNEARLIEEFWAAVDRDAQAAPPVELDPALARLIRRLDRDVQLPDPSDRFVGELRAQLRTSAPAGRSGWTRSALDRRRTQRLTDTADEEIDMSRSSGTPDAVPLPSGQRNWMREALKLAAAAIVFIAIGSILTLLLRDDDDGGNISNPGVAPTATVQPAPSPTIAPTQTPTVTPTPEATQTSQADVTATEAVVPTPTALPAVAPSLLPEIGEVAAITVGTDSQDHGIDFAAGAIWVSNVADGTVQRIDPATNQVVVTIEVRPAIGPQDYDPFMVASDGVAIWVLDGLDASLDGDLMLSRIDPATNQVVESFLVQTPEGSTIDGRFLAVADGALWISDWNNHRVRRVDPVTQTVVATIPVETPGQIVFMADSVWVASRNANRVVRIDPTTNEVVASIATGRFVLGIAPGEDVLWLSAADDEVLQTIDPATNQIVMTLALPAETDGEVVSAGDIVIGPDGIWVTMLSSNIYRLDPTTSIFTGILSAEGRVDVVAEGSLWVVATSGDTIERVNVTP